MKLLLRLTLTLLLSPVSGFTREICGPTPSPIKDPNECLPEELLGKPIGSFLRDGTDIVDQLDPGANELKLSRGILSLQNIVKSGRIPEPGDYLEVLKSTQRGEKLLQCYKEKFPDKPIKENIRSIQKFPYFNDPNFPPAVGLWDLEEKVLYVDLKNTSPLYVTITIAHELQHACDDSELHKAYHGDDEEFNQGALIGELRGYSVARDLFKELAKANPDISCNEVVKTTLFQIGKVEDESLSAGELFNRLERMENEGNFTNLLIRKYDLDANHLYAKDQTGSSGDEEPVLKNELIRKLNELTF